MKLFRKNNVIYIMLIAIGFFWCGSSYLSQEAELARILGSDSNFVNIIAIGIGSFAMAIGIIAYAVLCKLKANTKKIFIICLILCAILNMVFWMTNQVIIKSMILIITCILGTSGYGAGYHYALLGNRVDEKQIGKCFGIGYALGTIGTYILTIIPIVDLFSSWYSLFIYIPMISLNLYLIIKYGDMDENKETKNRKIETKTIVALGVMIAIMSLLANYSSSLLDTLMKGKLENAIFNRTFYALGLIMAGILVDKNKKALEFITIFSLLFSLITCVFIKEGISADVMQILCWFLTGFFTVFRTIFFIDFGQKNKKYLVLAGVGLAISRVVEGIYIFIIPALMTNYLAVIVALVLMFIILFLYYYFKYDKEMRMIRYECLPEKPSKEEKFNSFCNEYHLTRREKEVLQLLVQEKSGKEIADEISVTVGATKNILTKIYKKTSMKKEEIIKELNS